MEARWSGCVIRTSCLIQLKCAFLCHSFDKQLPAVLLLFSFLNRFLFEFPPSSISQLRHDVRPDARVIGRWMLDRDVASFWLMMVSDVQHTLRR